MAQHARRPGGRWASLGVTAAVVVILGVLAVLVVRRANRPMPGFLSLGQSPDPALQGTVAYLDGPSDCVRIVATAGQPSKEVLCLPPLDAAEAKTLGKPIGPQLVWLGDGRLEVTMFRMTDPPGPYFRRGWQKVVDVRTGAVTDTPAAQVPFTPNVAGRPVVSPAGERVSFTSDRSNGHVTITLTDATGHARTLLEVQGPGEYTYGLESAFWSPDFRSVLADDSRILIITTDQSPLVRVLTDQGYNGLEGDQARFAATTENLVTPSG